MKKVAFIFLLLFFAGHCFAQNPFKFGGQKLFLGMKGRVKTVNQETFELKWDNDMVVEELQGKEIFHFTKKGELKSKIISSDDYEKITTYSQYENGRAMRFGQEIRTPDYLDKDSSRLFIIDDRNEQLVTWRNYNREYSQIDTTLIRYTGEITEITPLYHFRKLEIMEVRDSLGNLIRETSSLGGRPGAWCMWTYDENDLLVSETGTKPAGFGMMDDYSFFYEYEDFDKHGNWRLKIVKVKESEYEENSDLITMRIIKRQIKYY